MRFIYQSGGASSDAPNLDTNNISQHYTACLHDLIERASERYRDHVALVCGDASLTYEELDKLSNAWARILVKQGVGSKDIVGVALERSVELVVILLAILKTGAAYLPIEPALPQERVAHMVEDADVRLLMITSDTFENLAREKDIPWLNIRHSFAMIQLNNDDAIEVNSTVSGNDLAYIMYTSGSTGRPKGVEITHASVCNLLLSLQREPGCNEADRLLAITTISFDMAVVELFLPLLCGATTIIAQRHEVKDMSALVSLMERHQVTIMQGTPSIWQMLLDSDWHGVPRLAKIFCGGERLPRKLASRLLECGNEVWNMYGPTEATVYAGIWRVDEGEEIYIGGPIKNVHLYVLDADLSPMAPGKHGELYIGGAGVAQGYHQNKELSRAKFVRDPFDKGLMYRTGDNAYLAPSGLVKVMGRADDQIKLRGYRIEPGDIETAIADHEDISRAVVVSREDRLVAFVIQRAKPRANGNTERQTDIPIERKLRGWLKGKLPSYMIPAFFVEVEAFSITANGKIDKTTLPDHLQTHSEVVPSLANGHDVEAKILACWSKVLGHDQFGPEDNFFEKGGDSVRVIRLQKELRDSIGCSVASPKLFEYYTVRALAAYLGRSTSSPIADTILHVKSQLVQDSHIAVVGMACRLPGGVTTPEEFWQILLDGADVITNVPEGRWRFQDELSRTPGGFLASVYSYDTSLMGISPREASKLDPSQYLMLETCWEGFEHAGYTLDQLRDSSTGVFIGASNILSHQSLNLSSVTELSHLDGQTITGSAAGTLSGRISYRFGLQGPTMTIDTACSSSLVTTHLACNALRLGECDMAVSGGITLMLNPGLHVEFERLGGMSPDGRCRSFSDDANGTGWSEGSVVIIMKRLCDAQRDGDQIHAVIRGSAVNHDGPSASLTTPSGQAQQRLIHKALSVSSLEAEDLDYIEAHGTGTRLGDPIEATAIAEVFGASRASAKPLLVGSAKSNFGHTQAAAGLVGLLKVILSMQKNTLPKTLHINKPNPAVDWEGAHMAPVLCNQAWSSDQNRLRRAGISAFGIGGTNAHVILEEAPETNDTVMDTRPPTLKSQAMVFVISGDDSEALKAQAERLHTHISTEIDQGQLVDLAFSLAVTRNHLHKRRGLIASGKDELMEQLESINRPQSLTLSNHDGLSFPPKVAMLFTGQGSQWLNMGRALYDTSPFFKEKFTEIVTRLDLELEVPLLQVMWADPGSAYAALLDRTDYSQAALFALQAGLWHLWRSWGISPDFVLGHSLGEVVAAYAAGVFDLHDACRLVTARGCLMQNQRGNYAMVSLEADAVEATETIQRLGLDDIVEIGLYNTPAQTVISGKEDAVRRVAADLSGRGRKTKTVTTGYAFHSRFMSNMLKEFRSVVETLHFKPPHLSFIKGVDGTVAQGRDIAHAEYWVQQVRRPVYFTQGMQTLAMHGANTFIELGPEQILCAMGSECFSGDTRAKDTCWLPSLTRRVDPHTSLQNCLARLHVRRVPIDWRAYFEPFGCKRIQLPTYAFQRSYTVPKMAEQSLLPVHQRSDHDNELKEAPPNSISNSVQFHVSWHAAKTNTHPPHATWGFLAPSGGSSWASGVISSLSTAGLKLVRVQDFEECRNLAGLICLWDSQKDGLLQSGHIISKALEYLHTAVETQFAHPLIWITHHVVGTGIQTHDQSICLGSGPLLWGLIRTARTEHPELTLRIIDATSGCGGNDLVSALMLSEEPECIVRHAGVLIPRMKHSLPSKDRIPMFRAVLRTDGPVLITGGAGHLGRHIARWLVVKHGVRDLVLTSRHGLESKNADALMREFSELGARVEITACDVSKPDAIDGLISRFDTGRPLRGIVHAAGVVDSGVLTSMTPERCETTIAPKAYGAWLLHQATRDMDVDLFLMISSISGILGMPGLANYAAANTFLDSLAYFRRAQGLPATTIAFGTLGGEDGMASKLSYNTLTHLSEFGLDPLPLENGLELVESAITSNRPLTIAANLDLKRLQRFMEQEGKIPPFLDQVLMNKKVKSQADILSSKTLRSKLSEIEADKRDNLMLESVQQVVAKALGFNNLHDVQVDRPLKDIGIDSLTAVQIRNHLATLTGLKLSVNVALAHPNLGALSRYLLAELIETSPSFPGETSLEPLDMVSILNGHLDGSFRFTRAEMDDSLGGILWPPKTAFLTGATGFVGAFILKELVARKIRTYCLIRADGVDHALQRLVDTLQAYDLWQPDYASLVIPIVGDISKHRLGLNKDIFEKMAYEVDAICHSGGLVDWMRPLQDYVGPNLVSAHEILRLASQGRAKTIHLISTISTLPKHMGLDLQEKDMEYGYGTSKFLAEKMVSAARWRGATAYTYRLPYVTASTASGHFRQDRGDFLHNFITGCLEMRTFPLLQADLSAVLPVDYLAKTVVAFMVRIPERKGQDFDFRNSSAPSSSDFFRNICLANGTKDYEMIMFDQWKQRALSHALKHPSSPISRIVAIIDSFTNETADAIFKGLAVGDHILGGDDHPAPRIDEAFIKLYLARITNQDGLQ